MSVCDYVHVSVETGERGWQGGTQTRGSLGAGVISGYESWILGFELGSLEKQYMWFNHRAISLAQYFKN